MHPTKKKTRTGKIVSAGSKANRHGKKLENCVLSTFLSEGYIAVNYNEYEKNMKKYENKPLIIKNVPYVSIFGSNCKSEFVALNPLINLNVRIECKWQQTKGTADEKLTTALMNAVEQKEKNIILLIDGGGQRESVVNWLKQQSKELSNNNKLISVMNMSEFLIWSNKIHE